MTSEDDFHQMLDDCPDDWQTRLIFADWLQERDDPRAAGYRAIALQRRRPLQGFHNKQQTWWWHCPPVGDAISGVHNNLPFDWFSRLPARFGNKAYWPAFTIAPGVKSRRDCEDALAFAFAALPAARQAELLVPAVMEEPEA